MLNFSKLLYFPMLLYDNYKNKCYNYYRYSKHFAKIFKLFWFIPNSLCYKPNLSFYKLGVFYNKIYKYIRSRSFKAKLVSFSPNSKFYKLGNNYRPDAKFFKLLDISSLLDRFNVKD